MRSLVSSKGKKQEGNLPWRGIVNSASRWALLPLPRGMHTDIAKFGRQMDRKLKVLWEGNRSIGWECEGRGLEDSDRSMLIATWDSS